ncbi:MAG: biopolymer transporter ExbD [Candidatus Eiseniibacteriota bacterium]|nr:MAG: biopolymer transporter ExbD [Candidatus Eisenbacteria bacterium]
MNLERKSLSEINVTPFVDVVLVLLVIFMLTAPFIQGAVDVDLPRAEAKEVDLKEGLIVSISKEERVYLDREIVPLPDLEYKLSIFKDAFPGRPVFLRADKEVRYGFVVRVISILKKVGIENLGLVADFTEEPAR